ncbi:MAG TPA: hypothetical protein VHE35_02475 [Kofleriaceae bacterium]|nr:hypothetical protein [Kofleriaceae bacterium]
MASRILAVLFVFWLWPGTGEAMEYVVHWVQDGDAVHGPRHPLPAPGDEDGCPDSSHLCHLSFCSCWNTTAPVMTAALLPPPAPSRTLPRPAPITRPGCEDPAPPMRPPIA